MGHLLLAYASRGAGRHAKKIIRLRTGCVCVCGGGGGGGGSK